MQIIVWIMLPIFLFILVMYCIQRGREKKIGLIGVILIMIFASPFFGYFIVESLANHKRPCKWCGNKDNEADFCGLCGKNEAGELKPSFHAS
jgi:hypothetical protein